MAELNGARIAAMLAADAQLDVGAGLAAKIGSHLHQLANAVLIEPGKRIGLIDLRIIISIKELTCVITRDPNAICVKSFVPKQKKSASFAMSSAVRAALGISIMVPTS